MSFYHFAQGNTARRGARQLLTAATITGTLTAATDCSRNLLFASSFCANNAVPLVV
jgi:hypothetical protein